MGPADPGGFEDDLNWPGSQGGVTSANMIDDLGTPKQLDEFYRWTTPHLTYGFDQSFVEYFGTDGIAAVTDAMDVLNDFFSPRDGSYNGVSALNLARHGFAGNYNTAWLNGTAYNQNLIDVKSLTLGIMVNYLGLGNPYRHAFTATNAIQPTAASGLAFSIALKNYDPVSLEQSDMINGVQFSYRLIHDQPPGVIADTNTMTSMTLDMEEFTADTSGNSFSAVSATVDAFYGSTALVWTDPPSIFGFGVFYDGLNAMGGMYKPRHALTYDDAGGLKYLYSTNTIAMEYNPYTLIQPADYTHPVAGYGLPPTGSELFNRTAGVFPVRSSTANPGASLPIGGGGGLATATTHPLNQFANASGILSNFSTGSEFWGPNVGKMVWAYRGGIDRIQFHPVAYDSLLAMNHSPTNFIWQDTFMTNALIQKQIPATANNTTPGASIGLTAGSSHYFTQTLGRTAIAPDFIFRADPGLTQGGVGVPTAFSRSTWNDPPDMTNAVPGGVTNIWAAATRWNAYFQNHHQSMAPGQPGPGVMVNLDDPSSFTPGTSSPSGFQIAFNSAFAVGGFELFWNGEVSKVGDLTAYPVSSQMWAYIKGPGAQDIVTFPNRAEYQTLLQNTILPVAGVPVITLVSDNGGQTAISPNSLTRTQETLTILGRNFRSATAIEIVGANNEVVQLIYPVTDYIRNDSKMDIPVGIIGYDAEGVGRRVRVWNTVGASTLSEEQFSITTGPPVVTSTTYDGLPFDRENPLTITGVGFKSRQVNSFAVDGNATITHIRIEDTQGNAIYPVGGNGTGQWAYDKLTILSDFKAVLRGGFLPASADGSGRMLRVSRGNPATLSQTPTTFFEVISTKPTVTSLNWVDLATNVETAINASGALRRDEAIFIRGEGLNTTTSVELVQENGAPFIPPVTGIFNINDLEDNGTIARLAKFAFNSSSADGHSSTRAKLKLVNVFGDHIYSSLFNVNIQPNDGTAAANKEVGMAGMIPGADSGIDAMLWNRDPETGDDITFTGIGLKAIKAIYIENANGTDLDPQPVLTLDANGTPGVLVTDTLIRITNRLAQFSNINRTDATSKTDYMRFRLESDRDEIGSSQGVGQRFIVGIPPEFTGISFDGLSNDVPRTWRRDHNNATIAGKGLQLLERLDITDKQGVIIALNSGVITPNNNITVTSGTQIDLNGTAFSSDPWLLDTPVSLNRRIKLTTPWGTVFSDDNASGAFSMSATPIFPTTVGLTFAGIGSGFNGIDTYDLNATTGVYPNNLLPLYINGQNFLGVKTITFEDNASNVYYSVNVDPGNPPAGITFKNDGTQVIIGGKLIYDNAFAWANSAGQGNRRIKLSTNPDSWTQSIKTDPFENDDDQSNPVTPTITSISGTGFGSANHYERNGTLIVTGNYLEGATKVALVDAAGLDIAGAAALTVGVGGIVATPTTITIPGSSFGGTHHAADSTVALSRRVKITFTGSSVTSNADATGAFTVSSVPAFGTVVAITYAAIGGADGGAAAGTYSPVLGNGNISITATDANMSGVNAIQFWDQGDGAKVPGTTDLTSADWTVSADGRSITIAKATIDTKGANWYAPDSDRMFRLTTVAGRVVDTPAIATSIPTFASLTGTGLTVNDFARDTGTLIFNGTELATATHITLVDAAGNDIAGVAALAVNGGTVAAAATTITVNANQFPDTNGAIDTTGALGRRVKVTFPNGYTITTPNNATGAFTVSATPAFGAVDVAYGSVAGTGYDTGSDTYSPLTGDGSLKLTATGADMRGVKTIQFWDNSGGEVGGTTALTTADWTVSADGTLITITKATMDAKGANWYTGGETDRHLRLTTAANVTANTGQITTYNPALGGTPLGGTGLAANNFRRDAGTLTIAGTDLSKASGVVLLDNGGNPIATTQVNAGGTLTVAATLITVNADAFPDTNGDTDITTAFGRRVRVIFPNGTNLDTTADVNGAFTVSATPAIAAGADAAYAGAGDGNANSGVYDRSTGDGSLSITNSAGADMEGVKTIEWMDAGGVVAGTLQLVRTDWTVSADGTKITISGAKITEKGLNWFTPGGAGRYLRLTTAGGQTVNTPAITAQP
tara:strand:- start:2119 stop:8322 length:6204 start_codon:yes stop_codon:yes gene_type:complete